MAIKATLILKSDQTEGVIFGGSGRNHIFISLPADSAWESGVVELQVINPHDTETTRWRTIEKWDPDTDMACQNIR